MKPGWNIKKLGECFSLKSGERLASKMMNSSGTYHVFGGNGIAGTHDSFNLSGNNIIIGRVGALCGNVRQVNGEVWLTDNAFKLVNYKYKFDYSFLTYLLNFKNLRQYARQSAQPVISNSSLKEVVLEFPSIREQKRIVAILDKAFTAIDKAKANTQQNLKNAKELFQSYLQGVFENKDRVWEKKLLAEITLKIGSGATPKGGKSSYKTEGVSLIRSMNVHDLQFVEKNLAFIDDGQANSLANVILQENDILLNITGASVTRSCIVPKQYLPARVNQHVSIIRTKKDVINPIFLSFLLVSKHYKSKLLDIAEQGATRQAITKLQLEEFNVFFPKSIKEQQAIVTKLSTFSSKIKKLENIYQKKLDNLEELKKSILQKAFSGELNTEKELEL